MFAGGFERLALAFAPHDTERKVAGDAAEPRFELGAILQRRELFPRRDERLLRHVLAASKVAHDAVGECADERLMAFDQWRVRFTVTAQAPLQQGGVSGTFDGNVHSDYTWWLAGKR